LACSHTAVRSPSVEF